jgi:hypothetical protein
MPLLLIASLIIFLFVGEFFGKLVIYSYFSYVVVKLKKKNTIKPNIINFIEHQKFINSNIHYNTNFTIINTSLHKWRWRWRWKILSQKNQNEKQDNVNPFIPSSPPNSAYFLLLIWLSFILLIGLDYCVLRIEVVWPNLITLAMP